MNVATSHIQSIDDRKKFETDTKNKLGKEFPDIKWYSFRSGDEPWYLIIKTKPGLFNFHGYAKGRRYIPYLEMMGDIIFSVDVNSGSSYVATAKPQYSDIAERIKKRAEEGYFGISLKPRLIKA